MAFTDQGAFLDTSERVHIGGTGDPVISLKVTGEIYATSNITAYYSSDITLKDNVRPIESAIFKVKQISGVEFDWNEKSSQLQQELGHDVGLIAQEVEKVLPEIVITVRMESKQFSTRRSYHYWLKQSRNSKLS